MAGAILAFEAVELGGSVAWLDADGGVRAQHHIAPRRVPIELVALLQELLLRHGRPAALAVAVGPGSFTGLRIAAVAARTLAWVEELPVHAVDTMAAIALASGPGRRLVLLPQKRDATFHGLFEVDAAGQVRALSAIQARADGEGPLPELPPEVLVIGPALAAKPDLAARWAPGSALGPATSCDAVAVGRAARGHPAGDWRAVRPCYHVASAPEQQRAARQEV